MGLSAAAGKALGKLFRNIRNPRWVAQEVGQTAFTMTVLNPAAQRVKAKLKGKGHIHHDDGKEVAEVYHCDDGHNYLRIGDKTYCYDAATDSWSAA
jgi:hypothetical protein